MTDQFFKRLVEWIASGNVHRFYVTKEWRRVSAKVLDRDKHECQICKSKGRYAKADLVHHINHVKNRPDLALSEEYKDYDGTVKRNLISVCKNCHENECHPERLRKYKKQIEFDERWD